MNWNTWIHGLSNRQALLELGERISDLNERLSRVESEKQSPESTVTEKLENSPKPKGVPTAREAIMEFFRCHHVLGETEKYFTIWWNKNIRPIANFRAEVAKEYDARIVELQAINQLLKRQHESDEALRTCELKEIQRLKAELAELKAHGQDWRIDSAFA
jgi:hypothetical protein